MDSDTKILVLTPSGTPNTSKLITYCVG